MLLALLRKELIGNGKAFLLYTCFVFLYLLMSFADDNPQFGFMMCFIMAFFLPYPLIFREERYNLNKTMLSLPIPRKTYYTVKLITSNALSYITILLFIGAFLLVNNMTEYYASTNHLVTDATLLNGILLVTLIHGIMMPFVLRYGSIKGVVIVIIAIKMIIFLLILTLTNKNTAHAYIDKLQGIIGALQSQVAELLSNSGFFAGSIMTITLMTAITMISIQFGTFLLKGRNY